MLDSVQVGSVEKPVFHLPPGYHLPPRISSTTPDIIYHPGFHLPPRILHSLIGRVCYLHYKVAIIADSAFYLVQSFSPLLLIFLIIYKIERKKKGEQLIQTIPKLNSAKRVRTLSATGSLLTKSSDF
jgi:hypothetical protein